MSLVIAAAAFAWYAITVAVSLAHPETTSYDFRVYYQAAGDFARGSDPYGYALRCCGGVFGTPGGYTYPPLLAQLMRPLAALSIEQATRAWLVLSHLALVGAVYLTWRLIRARVTVTALAILLTATLLFRPLQVTVDLRQVNLLLAFIMAVAAYSYARSRAAAAAGAAIALGAMIKLLPALLLLALVRAPGRLRLRILPGLAVAAAVALLLTGFMLVSSRFTGVYFTRLLPRLAAGSGVYLNQSLAGVSLRAQVFLLGDASAVLRAVTSVIALGLAALTWFLGRRRDDEAGRLAVFASLLALVPLVSTITWDHHLVTEMLAIGLAAPLLAPRTPRWWLAVAAYPLLWLPDSAWVSALAGLGAPRPIVVLLGGSIPAVGIALLWVACLLCLRVPSPGSYPWPGEPNRESERAPQPG